VIFGLAVMESFLGSSPTRTVLCLAVPRRWYPWVLLVVLQMLIPNISFVGHLSGLLVGFMLVTGLLQSCTFPSDERLLRVENAQWWSWVRKRPSYVLMPASSVQFQPEEVCGYVAVANMIHSARARLSSLMPTTTSDTRSGTEDPNPLLPVVRRTHGVASNAETDPRWKNAGVGHVLGTKNPPARPVATSTQVDDSEPATSDAEAQSISITLPPTQSESKERDAANATMDATTSKDSAE